MNLNKSNISDKQFKQKLYQPVLKKQSCFRPEVKKERSEVRKVPEAAGALSDGSDKRKSNGEERVERKKEKQLKQLPNPHSDPHRFLQDWEQVICAVNLKQIKQSTARDTSPPPSSSLALRKYPSKIKNPLRMLKDHEQKLISSVQV